MVKHMFPAACRAGLRIRLPAKQVLEYGLETLREDGLVTGTLVECARYLYPAPGGRLPTRTLSTAYGCGVSGFEIRLRFHNPGCSRNACNSRIATAKASLLA